jgi:hypothetical protein
MYVWIGILLIVEMGIYTDYTLHQFDPLLLIGLDEWLRR